MNLEELKALVKEAGVAGAGGAGFPTYMKLDERAEVIIMNCAECEPLLNLHQQLLGECAGEILRTLSAVAHTLHANRAIIGIKKEYTRTIEAVQQHLEAYPEIKMHLLQSVFPMGDEAVLIYETTGKILPPGGLPAESGVVVMNVETIYNICRALEEKKPVTDKIVAVAGEVNAPGAFRVPLGTSMEDVVKLAGGETQEDTAYLSGGPMMGKLVSRYDPVIKTTNAIFVLPKEHLLINRRKASSDILLKRAASACCQCQMCTSLCPRYNLGYPIQPHRFMRAASHHDCTDLNAYLNLFSCSGCGLCESFSCPQGLSPRKLIGEFRNQLRAAGVQPAKSQAADFAEMPEHRSERREGRKVSEKRLTARLGLGRYSGQKTLLDNRRRGMEKVRIPVLQHIGAPAVPVVKAGDFVCCGQLIGRPADGLSLPVHASIDGKITNISEKYIEITSI